MKLPAAEPQKIRPQSFPKESPTSIQKNARRTPKKGLPPKGLPQKDLPKNLSHSSGKSRPPKIARELGALPRILNNLTTLKGFGPKAITGGKAMVKAETKRLHLPFGKDSKSSRIALNLLLVRPWILLIGFWLFSMLGAGLALEGLISPKRLTTALPEVTEITPTNSENTLIKVETSAEESGPENTANNPLEEALVASESDSTDSTTANTSEIPAWPLVGIVGASAVGCLVISRRRAMMRMAAVRSRHKGRKTVRPSANKAANKLGGAIQTPIQIPQAKNSVKNSTKSTPSKLVAPPSKKRRPRSKQSLASQQPANSNRVLVSRSTAQPASPKQTGLTGSKNNRQQGNQQTGIRPGTRPVERTPSRVASRRQSVVSVVPASESHALDWSNGSLAHQLDVRPQRTASM